MERAIQADAAIALLDVAIHAHHHKFLRINMAYKRVDDARNTAAALFWQHSQSDEDVLVMLDNDHTHPPNIVAHLASKCDAEHEVVGALMFRRSLPHDPCFYHLDSGKQGDVGADVVRWRVAGEMRHRGHRRNCHPAIRLPQAR